MTRSPKKPSSNTVDLEDYRWLLGPEGEGWLRRVEEDDRDVVALTAALRKELSASRSHLVLEQRDLRRRGRRKFAQAGRMFFTQIGLELATDQVVAGYKARRFPEGAARMDLCCGIGGDLLSLAAGGPTLGVDRDRIAALLAAENLCRTGSSTSGVVVADVERLAWCPDVIWHLDPDRRRQEGRRSVQPRWHQPNEITITEFLARAPHAAVKLAPATSALSSFNFGVERLQFFAGVFDFELPIDAALVVVGVFGPVTYFALQFPDRLKPAARDALSGHAAQFVLGDVEPTAVLGRVAKVEPFHIGPSLRRRKGFGRTRLWYAYSGCR